MKGFNSEQTLWAIFPMIIVVILLIAGIIFLPQTQNDVRSRASEPKPAIITPPAKPTETNPEIVCSDLYAPVCGVDGKTYINSCEASVAQILSFYPGACNTTPMPSPSKKPASNLQYPIPVSN